MRYFQASISCHHNEKLKVLHDATEELLFGSVKPYNRWLLKETNLSMKSIFESKESLHSVKL